MKLVPRPSTASPVNRAPLAGTKKTTWSHVCPGVCDGQTSTPPDGHRWPSRSVFGAGEPERVQRRPDPRRTPARPARDRGGRASPRTAATRPAARCATSSRWAGSSGPGSITIDGASPDDPRVRALQRVHARVRSQDAHDPQHRQSCQNTERGSRSTSSSSGSRVSKRSVEQIVLGGRTARAASP